MKKKIYSLATFAIILALLATPLPAQVTVGDLQNPESFSILELISNGNRGLRLPQLTTAQRDAITTADFKANALAQGLQIFNTTTKCVETWNGTVWILTCECGDAPCPIGNNVIYIGTKGVVTAELATGGTTTVSGDAATIGNSPGSEMAYIWQKSDDDGGTWADAGVTTQNLGSTGALSASVQYRRIVIDALGRKDTSNIVSVTVCTNYTISDNTIICPSGTVSIPSGTGIVIDGSVATLTPATGTITYLWQQSSNNIDWVAASGTNNTEDYTTPNLTAQVYYRRIASVSGGCTVINDTSASVEIGIVVKTTYTANGVSFDMVSVEGGSKYVGTSSGANNVTISSFTIGQTEVTQGLWTAVMTYSGAGGGKHSGINLVAVNSGTNGYFSTQPSSSYGAGANYPAYYVSWQDAILFCNRLSLLTGKDLVYSTIVLDTPEEWAVQTATITATVTQNISADGFRLPTEAEWEYAARGGQKDDGGSANSYAGSDNIECEAWYSGNNTPSGSKPVATKMPNELGIYDMSGNICEWCWDWYDSSTYPYTDTNPTGNSTGSNRVVRGGSWGDTAPYCRVSYCYGGNPTGRYYGGGFRVVSVP